jgi:hypothetical protein
MTKPLKNGHDKPAETQAETAAAIRMRRYKARKAKGIVVLRNVEVGPDTVAALAANGWLHESETRNAGAVEHALHALLPRALGSGMSPNPTKATLEIDVEAVRDAIPWLPDGTPLDARSGAKAMEIVSRAAATVGFNPAAYAARLNAMVREIEARGIVQSTAH